MWTFVTDSVITAPHYIPQEDFLWTVYYRPQRGWGRLYFYRRLWFRPRGGMHSRGGGCVAWLACIARGHAWLGGCMTRGACVAGGHAWLGGPCMAGVCVAGGLGACMAGGMCGWGACMTCTPPGRYYGYGIRSMSGRHASYWNAFLLYITN